MEVWAKKTPGPGVDLQSLFFTIRFSKHQYTYLEYIQSFKSKWDSGAGPPDPNLDTLPREPRLRWVDFYFSFRNTLRGDLVPDMVRHWWDCDAVWGVVRLVLRRGCLHVMGFKGLPVLPVPVQGTPGQLLWRKSRKSPQWIGQIWIEVPGFCSCANGIKQITWKAIPIHLMYQYHP